jgi:hypothetical protein
MNTAGFPGREGAVLYVLGQVANGWPVGQPASGDDPELVALETYYSQIQMWYDAKIVMAEAMLTKDPALTITIIANDLKDRFGCRIGPPTYSRLQQFGNRVQVGTVVPESEY